MVKNVLRYGWWWSPVNVSAVPIVWRNLTLFQTGRGCNIWTELIGQANCHSVREPAARAAGSLSLA